MKKLYRSKNNRKIGGVCGGLAEYFNIDPLIIRIICAVVLFSTGFFIGILIYIVCMFVIPEEGEII